ncbi:chloramphenicol acetyltransferase [Clostridium sp. CAG:505]|nr:chloramphenicol acetyltransferase [Clostridium sp. CAG:505]
MTFTPIDMETWHRKPYFLHYHKDTPCTYSMTVSLDITVLKKTGVSLYPALLYLLTKNVNRYEQFRTAFDEKGNVGIYSNMEPCYTIFHKEQETFSNLWTEYSEDFSTFLARYKADLETYGNVLDMDAKPNTPPNTFPVSMVPWTTFTGFHLHLQKGYDYLLPIFTLGKAWEHHGHWKMPLAIQVHHGVCDGFHVSRFVESLQQDLHQFQP